MDEPTGYIDTSALVKWYVWEPGSDQVAGWVESQPLLALSRLASLELGCAVRRRVRSGSLPAALADEALEHFAEDLRSGAFTLLPLLDEQVMAAEALLDRTNVPLRALDALHLAAAQAVRAVDFATADRQLAAAAESLQLSVHYFGNPR